LVRQFGTGPYKEVVSAKDGALRRVQGPNSRLAKFKPTMCAKCNNERSQPFDLAYDSFTSYLDDHERHVLASRSVDLRAVYGTAWEAGRDELLRFLAKHIGCRLAENEIEVPESIRGYLDGGPEPNPELSIEFEIRADIAKASKTILADGSMWLGDIIFSDFDEEAAPWLLRATTATDGSGSPGESDQIWSDIPGRFGRRFSRCRMVRTSPASRGTLPDTLGTVGGSRRTAPGEGAARRLPFT
jgi:hypothetical protein